MNLKSVLSNAISRRLLLPAAAGLALLGPAPATAQEALGGFVENTISATLTPMLSQSEIQALLPSRGPFTFPAPYNTEGTRITNSGDCSGGDCVHYVGYSYWRNSNNHVNSNTMLIFLGLMQNAGGSGLTLFEYNKTTGDVSRRGPLFPAGSSYNAGTGEGIYFSGSMPNKLYLRDFAQLLRYDVETQQFETVFDVRDHLGSNRYLWQIHSSDDDRVHSATVRDASSYAMLGCAVYREDTGQFLYYPKQGDFDECQIDRSGRWLVIKENVDGSAGEDNRIINVDTGAERVLIDQDGAAGHSDMGYGYMVAADNWNNEANANRLWKFDSADMGGTLVYHNNDWGVAAPAHVSHTNAQAGLAPEEQFACGSSANGSDSPHANEIICFRLDGSEDVLVVAPVMTNLSAPGGGDNYSKMPKGNLDVTGQYFIWTSNMGGSRMDAFVVKVPSHLLVDHTPTDPPADVTNPSVSLIAPFDGASVSSTVTVSANASDDVGVAGVQFKLDGANLGAEDTSSPYSLPWDTSSVSSGSHTLTAVARDFAGNTSTSAPVSVNVGSGSTPPVISNVSASVITPDSATIVWTTSAPADSQVEYGTSSSYGSSTSRDPNLVTTHSQSLSGLSANTTYHYRVKSSDAQGNPMMSGDSTFTTPDHADNTPAGGISVSFDGKIADEVGQGNVARGSDGLLDGVFTVTLSSQGGDRTVKKIRLEGADRGAWDTLSKSANWTLGAARSIDGPLLNGSGDGVDFQVSPGGSFRLFAADWRPVFVSGSVFTVTLIFADGSSASDTVTVGGKSAGISVSYDGTASDQVGQGNRSLDADGLADGVFTVTLSAASGNRTVTDLRLDGPVGDVWDTNSWTRIWSLGASRTIGGPLLNGPGDAVNFPVGAGASFKLIASDWNPVFVPGSAFTVTVYFADGASASETVTISSDPSGTPDPVVSAENVVWENPSNLTISGTRLEKTAGCDGCEDAGAVSQQAVSSDGYMEFTAIDTAALRYVGLKDGSAITSASDLNASIRLQSGYAEVRENDAWQADISFVSGDVFRISVSGNTVSYSKNGTVFHTSTASFTAPAHVQAIFYEYGGAVADVMLATP